MSNSGFLDEHIDFESIEQLETQGGTSEAFVVKIKGKSYFMKRLRAQYAGDPKMHSIFEKEFEVGSSLNSPYIPQYTSINKENGGLYILMEYVLGENIESRLKSNPQYFCNEKNIRKLLLQLLEGLGELHSKDILYLDITPKNIMLTRFGNNVKITDLGFCANATYHTTMGCTVGFRAPEVEHKRWNEIDAQSDIYSVGLLLHYIQKHSGAKFTRHINNFMQRCLSKSKKQRFADCGEAIRALKSTGKWMPVAVVALFCTLVAVVCATVLQPVEMSTILHGVEYMVLSQENLTCAVAGGTGLDYNVYIEQEVTIGNRVYRTVAIKDSAFNRSGILSVDIPEGIETVGHGAFHRCDNIVALNIPGTVKNFTGAFIRMENVKRISLPVVKEICSSAFVADCSVEGLIIPEGVERICRDAFVSCTALKEVSLPQSLKVLERGVFYNCRALAEITIPAQVTEIGDYAFYECDSLESFYCCAMVPPRITAIFNTKNVTVYVPVEAVDVYKRNINWRDYNICPMPGDK